MREKIMGLIKEKIINIKNKDFYIFMFLMGLIQIIPILGSLSGQSAKINFASFLLIIYLPIILISIYKNKILIGDKKLILIFVLPIIFEFAFNIINKNNNQLGYIDLSVISIATIFSLYLINFHQKIEDLNKRVGALIIFIAILTAISSLVEIFINKSVGRFIMGNQNIAAYVLLVSLPFINYFKFNKIYKILYLIVIILLIAVFYKARLATLIGVLYSFVYLKDLINPGNKKFFFATWIISASILLLALILQNERFNNLLKVDIFFRLMPWERIFYGIEFNDILVGIGTGNYALILYKLQNTFSSIEIIFSGDTFIHAHNFLIDRFVSGGIFVFFAYAINYMVIIHHFYKKNHEYYEQKYLFHAFILGLTLSLFDIVHNHISGYLIFQFITICLIIHMFNKLEKIKTHLCVYIFVLVVPAILMILQVGGNLNHHIEYNKLVGLVNEKKITDSHLEDFTNKFPHYAEVDSIRFYNRLFNNGMKFDESLSKAFDDMNLYNRFSQKRLHFSTQYYSLNNDNNKLIETYEDILYKKLISFGIISLNYQQSNIKILVSRKTGDLIFNSVICCSLDIPEDIFSQLKFINSGISSFKITDSSINSVIESAIYDVDTHRREKDTYVLKSFFQNINEFSELLKF